MYGSTRRPVDNAQIDELLRMWFKLISIIRSNGIFGNNLKLCVNCEANPRSRLGACSSRNDIARRRAASRCSGAARACRTRAGRCRLGTPTAGAYAECVGGHRFRSI